MESGYAVGKDAGSVLGAMKGVFCKASGDVNGATTGVMLEMSFQASPTKNLKFTAQKTAWRKTN
jgi:hypothetical protein